MCNIILYKYIFVMFNTPRFRQNAERKSVHIFQNSHFYVIVEMCSI